MAGRGCRQPLWGLPHVGQRSRRRKKFKERHAQATERYLDAARGIILPKVGYGLMSDLKRSGVFVRQVSDAPQAADEALKDDMQRAVSSRQVDVLFLVSDDGGYAEILRWAREHGLRVVVIGHQSPLKRVADLFYSWDQVTSGRARVGAHVEQDQWQDRQALLRELAERSEPPDNGGLLDVPPNMVVHVSAFTEDEDDFAIGEDEEDMMSPELQDYDRDISNSIWENSAEMRGVDSTWWDYDPDNFVDMDRTDVNPYEVVDPDK
eukprot:jgi/Mesen1/10097/ME000074S09440